jgi:hypothetical protein
MNRPFVPDDFPELPNWLRDDLSRHFREFDAENQRIHVHARLGIMMEDDWRSASAEVYDYPHDDEASTQKISYRAEVLLHQAHKAWK